MKLDGLYTQNICQFIITHQSYLSYYKIMYFLSFVVILLWITSTAWIKFGQILMVNMFKQEKACLNANCSSNYYHTTQLHLIYTIFVKVDEIFVQNVDRLLECDPDYLSYYVFCIYHPRELHALYF